MPEKSPDAASVRRRSLMIGALWTVGLSAQQRVDDGVLYDRVHRKLNNHPALRIRDLRVEVSDGVVTIEGRVRSEPVKRRAVKVASIKGVSKVVNKLEVGP